MLIRGGRLFEAGRLLNFHYFATNQKKVITKREDVSKFLYYSEENSVFEEASYYISTYSFFCGRGKGGVGFGCRGLFEFEWKEEEVGAY